MNLTKTLHKQYKPEVAIMVYRSQDNDYYLESHEMQLVKGKHVLGAGIPLSEDTINSLVEYFKGKEGRESILKGDVPANVLYVHWGVEKRILIWHNPPMKRAMHFTKALAIPGGAAMQPGLIYASINGSLDVFAFEGYERPVGDTKLMRAPYHNVSRDGSVCLGSARVNKPRDNSYIAMMKYYEDLFWGSEFSHLAGEETPIRGNLNSYWKKAIKQHSDFDYSVLLPCEKRKKFSELINHINR